jgi:hypothetical protein
LAKIDIQMNTTLKTALFVSALLAGACGSKNQEHDHDHEHGHDHEHPAADGSPNQALGEEVMKVHDEVMPRMNDIYKLKEGLKKKLSETGVADDKKKEIEQTITQLDSASDGMMVWMRAFNPQPDSLDEEKTREYLENEMEKVKKVQENIQQAIAKAEAIH